MSQLRSIVGKATLLLLSCTVSIFGAEVGLRWVDQYRLSTPALTPLRADQENPANYSGRYLADIPIASGVDRSWYLLQPKPTNVSPNDLATMKELDPDLARIFEQTRPPLGFEAAYEWNVNWTPIRFCPKFPSHLSPDIFVFDPGNGAKSPRFRLVRNTRFPEAGAVLNSFGLRGTEISLNKPANTIRIAFLGASTTLDGINDRNAYPDFIENWLNVWARAEGIKVNFEALNGGRYGFGIEDIAAMFRDEILPLEPDLVLYYEGVNDFYPWGWVKWPNDQRPASPTITLRQRTTLENYSDVIKRGLRIFDELSWASGREVLKPTVPFEESPLIHDQNLDPHDAELPAHLKYLVANLDRMRLDAQSTNAEFTVLPYLFLVSDGLKLDVDRNFYLFKYLNDTFYPFSYSFLRKQIDFENLVFKRYDQTFEQPLIELDRLYPQDPNLFNDAVHLNLDGSRLKAWIIFNGLVKMLKGKIDKGELPRPMMHPLQIHPAFPNGAKRTIARVADLEKVCDAKH